MVFQVQAGACIFQVDGLAGTITAIAPNGILLNGLTWLTHVHGAKILTDMFNQMSETRVIYDKVEYGPILTKIIAESSPGAIGQKTSQRSCSRNYTRS